MKTLSESLLAEITGGEFPGPPALPPLPELRSPLNPVVISPLVDQLLMYRAMVAVHPAD